ncbi:Flp pilus assembly protein TadD [Caulobacter ginsengisoli]|uniref:Flp pilus assembly protein TadD n=1 Tax=Caulobacter ginsengisoli TaxID=400775 RepID=A0ABU0IWQ3_9CAUL|nr:tetratricopeptide repeat protein [Caulobacter ginsengisoli]MDQ0466433.1 Flp pilus assembly protein TadD [Caulobacter ginsengisoli]
MSMCRKPLLAATLLTLLAGLSTPALAWPGSKPKPAAPVAGAMTPADRPTMQTAGLPMPAKATPTQRAEAARLDPLGRATFWAREVQIDPTDVQANLGLAQSLRAMNQFDDAADAAQRVLISQPGNLDALLELARIRIAQGKGFYAIEPARQAQAVAPRDWRPLSLLAVAYEQAERDGEALAAYKQALSLAPNEPAVLTNMAMYWAGHGDLPQAERLLRRAASLPGSGIQTRQDLALVVGLQGRMSEAEALARQDLPPEMVANNIAWLKAATGQTPPPGGRSWDSVRAGGGR